MDPRLPETLFWNGGMKFFLIFSVGDRDSNYDVTFIRNLRKVEYMEDLRLIDVEKVVKGGLEHIIMHIKRVRQVKVGGVVGDGWR